MNFVKTPLRLIFAANNLDAGVSCPNLSYRLVPKTHRRRFISTGQAPPMGPAPPDNGRRRGEEGRGKDMSVPRRKHACTRQPARQNAGMAGLGQWGRAAVPPPSEAQPPAGLHGGRKEEGRERGSRREVRVRKIVSLPSWAAGKQDWFLVRDRGGRSMKVGARLVFRLPDPPHGRQPICLLLIAYNRRSLCQNCAQRHECAFRVRNRARS